MTPRGQMLDHRHVFFVSLLLASCYLYNDGPPASGGDDDDDRQDDDSSPGSSGDDDTGGEDDPLTGVPCEVAEILQEQCLRCHNGTPLSQSDLPLTSYDALTASAPEAAQNETVGQRMVARIHDGRSRMPPAPDPPLRGEDAQVIEDWVEAGYPRGDCGGGEEGIPVPDAGPGPFDTETTCSSGEHWNDGDDGSEDMHPGVACIDCHSEESGFFGFGGAPQFEVAGTVYPTAHEPDDCNGLGEGTVTITDATGQDFVLRPNEVGNFSAERLGIVTPYFAKVSRNGLDRVMNASQTDGDCNNCHTEEGSPGSGDEEAPGRIMMP